MRRYAYAYDNQGNRTTDGTTVNYKESGESNLRKADYTVNSRNQYTQREVPAFVDVAGTLSTTPTVQGNGVTHTVTKQGNYFYSLLDDNGSDGYNNASDDLVVDVSVSAGGELNEGDVYIAEDVEVFSYDDDGNLTSDGLWDYVWDAENQLTSMTMKDEEELPDGMSRKRIEFKYDYLRRRVQKVVKNNWNGSSGTTISNLKFVYDGHNQIAELNGSNNTVLSTYVWGLDLSGTIHGAGGVGGLLMIKDGSKVYFPGYDGNGNVSGLIDSADGSLDAKYEYAAFGETLRVGGTAIADDNPFRFSTKYTDVDGARKRVDGDAEGVARRAEEAGAPWALMRQSGLVYYGFRYYSPSLGRFLNRDPIGELGGSNLYGFVENDPVNGWDFLGLDDELVCDPADSAAGLCNDDLPIYEVPAGPELPPFEVFPPMPPPDPDPHPIDIEFPTEEPPDLGEREAPLGPNGGGGGTKKDGCDEKDKELEEKCKEMKSYIAEGNRKQAILGNRVRDFGENHWDAVRRGAARNLAVSRFIESREFVPLKLDTWATWGGVGIGTTLWVNDKIAKNSDVWAKHMVDRFKTLGRAGQGAAVLGAAARMDMAREGFQRGDYSVAVHYLASGALTAVSASKMVTSTPIGRGIAIGTTAGSIGEGLIWHAVDAPIRMALERANAVYEQNLGHLKAAKKLYKENCK